MKKTLLTLAFGLTATISMAQTNYEVRWANHPEDAKHYDTERLRKEFAIEKVFSPGEVNWVYSMYDRFLIGGAEPVNSPIRLTSIAPLHTDKPQDKQRLLDNRELGIINIGGKGTVTIDGKAYELGFQEALYVGRADDKNNKDIVLSSADAAHPAKFYTSVISDEESDPKRGQQHQGRLAEREQRPRDSSDDH